MKIEFRPADRNDTAFLWQMLFEAAHIAEEGATSVQAAKENPTLARYVQDWPRAGELGVVAEEDEQPIGAAWVRLWTNAEHGYGFVRADVPELAIAVAPHCRGRGVGEQLLRRLLTCASNHHAAISLSVRETNRALRLYERMGFRRIPGTEVTNRVGGLSFTMIAGLH